MQVSRSLAALAAAAAIATAAEAATFNGSATNGGNTANNLTWLYDTGNGLNGSVVSHAAATALGLGAVDAGGNFTAPPGTPTINPNNGAYSLWCFTGVTISLTDSAGNACPVPNQTVYVARNTNGGNATLAARNVVNAGWISAAGACLSGAGATARGYWNPGWTPPPPPQRRPAQGNSGFWGGFWRGFIWGISGGLLAMDYTYQSPSEHTFVPASLASAAGLIVTGSMDLTGTQSLHALEWDNLNPTGQTVFQTALLDQLDLDVGGPIQSGEVCIYDDSGVIDAPVVVGADFLADYIHIGGYGPGGEDVIGYVPSPGAFAIGGLGLLCLARRVRD